MMYEIPAHEILAIAGSLRQESLNRTLLQAMAERTPEGLSVRIYHDIGSVPLFNEDLESGGGPEGVVRLRDAVGRVAGILIATPEYNQSMPGVVKNLVDWLSRSDPDVLTGKPVGIVGATPGPWGTRLAQAALRQTLSACGALIMPAPQVYLANAAKAFDSARRLVDDRLDAQLKHFVQSFRDWVRRCANGRDAIV